MVSPSRPPGKAIGVVCEDDVDRNFSVSAERPPRGEGPDASTTRAWIARRVMSRNLSTANPVRCRAASLAV